MSYTPTKWNTGDVITANKLNNIEDGIANASGGQTWFNEIRIDKTVDPPTIDKTYDELDSLERLPIIVYIRETPDEPDEGVASNGMLMLDDDTSKWLVGSVYYYVGTENSKFSMYMALSGGVAVDENNNVELIGDMYVQLSDNVTDPYIP